LSCFIIPRHIMCKAYALIPQHTAIHSEVIRTGTCVDCFIYTSAEVYIIIMRICSKLQDMAKPTHAVLQYPLI